MFVDVVPNRNSPAAVLLRESYREGGKVKKRTLANLTAWPPAQIDALRAVLKGATAVGDVDAAFAIVRSLPHGHVAAVLRTIHTLQLDMRLEPKASRMRDLCIAMIAARVIAPGSKLALTRHLHPETATSSLGEVLALGPVTPDDLYAAMDWLLARQGRVEDALARRHLANGTLVLYDVSSTYFEGRLCPLAARGYSRDGRSDKLQIVFGLLTNGDGCPVAVEVFAGNTADPATVAAQVTKLKARFGLEQIILVGDRGMLTRARIEHDLPAADGIDWITCLRAPAVRTLVEQGVIQLSLFDERDLAEVTSPDYPNERLVVCRNPLLAAERTRKREDLLAATERDLATIRAATQRTRAPLRGAAAIGIRVGRVLGRRKMGKHFRYTITDDRFDYERDQANIDAEARLDGLYVLRTNVAAAQLADEDVVRSYKRLCQIERAFRSLKTVDLHVRPINHRLADRVRAHLFLCMLAYYVEWHMRQRLAPLLFDDHDRPAAEARRPSVVAPARPSPAAQRKARTKRTEDDFPVESFQDVLQLLGTITRNTLQGTTADLPAFQKITTPTPIQQRALELLGVRL